MDATDLLDKKQIAALTERYGALVANRHLGELDTDRVRSTAMALYEMPDPVFSMLMTVVPLHLGKNRLRHKEQLYSLAAQSLMKSTDLSKKSLESIAASILLKAETKKSPDWPALLTFSQSVDPQVRKTSDSVLRSCLGVGIDDLMDTHLKDTLYSDALHEKSIPQTQHCPYLNKMLGPEEFDTRFSATLTCDRMIDENHKMTREKHVLVTSGSLDDVILQSLLLIKKKEPVFDDVDSLHECTDEKPVMLEIKLDNRLIAFATILSEVKTPLNKSRPIRECFNVEWVRLSPDLTIEAASQHADMLQYSLTKATGLEWRKINRKLIVLNRIMNILTSPVPLEDINNKIYDAEKRIGFSKTKNKHLSDDLGL